jgi:hypothetical protein
MTPKGPEAEGSQDFLVADYGSVSFLIRRAQCRASVFLEATQPLDHPDVYLAASMNYQGAEVAVFDLDAWLRDTFGLPPSRELPLALITDVSVFGPANRELFQVWARGHDRVPCDTHVAFRLASALEMARLEAGRLRPPPPSMRSRLLGAGILGCRFASIGSLQYSLDVEAILSKALVRRKVPDESAPG